MDIRPDVPQNDALLAVVKENVKMQVNKTRILKNKKTTFLN